MPPPSYDVLIAGAGPAGSALAIRLAEAGARVALLDRSRFPRPKPCADYLGPEALRHLSTLGVLGAADRAGRPVTGTTVIASRGARLSGRLADASPDHHPFRPTGLALSRTVLDALLAEEAVRRGATLLERTAMVDLLRQGKIVTGCTTRGATGQCRTMHARLTVGADGLRSIVARRTGYHHQTPLRRLAFVQCLSGIEGLEDRIELHVESAGYVGVNRLGENLANVALVVPARRIQPGMTDPTEFFRSALREFPALAPRLRYAVEEGPFHTTGPFASRARRITGDGVALVGDAAEFFDPFTGEGVFTALAGAELLADAVLPALARGPARITARDLQSYAVAHRNRFRGKRLVERMIGYGMLVPALFDRSVNRLQRRGLAPTLLGVTADFVPARAVLNPVFLAGMVL